MVELRIPNPKVRGSSPLRPVFGFFRFWLEFSQSRNKVFKIMVAAFIGLILICCIIIIHESGHLIMAKLLGVKVEAFSIGFGPTVFSINISKTKYQLALIPFGGYVKMSEDLIGDDSFVNQNIFKKFLIIIAGPVSNICFGAFLFSLVALGFHLRTAAIIDKVTPGSVAARAGFLAGDYITSVNNISVKSRDQIIKVLLVRPEKTANLWIARDGKPKNLVLNCNDKNIKCTSKLSFRVFEQSGIELGNHKLGVIIYTSCRQALISGIHTTRLLVRSIGISTKRMINCSIFDIKIGRDIKIGGPIMIIGEAHQALLDGYAEYLQLMAFLSINVGIFNLLPLPVLDGGRMLFYVIEEVLGRSINKAITVFFMSISWLILLALTIFALFNDLQRLL